MSRIGAHTHVVQQLNPLHRPLGREGSNSRGLASETGFVIIKSNMQIGFNSEDA